MGTIFGEIFGPTTSGGVAKDTVAPTITIVSPTPGVAPGAPGGFSADWQTARMTPIVVDVTDVTPGIGYLCFVAKYPGVVDEANVYRRGAFRGSFLGLSSIGAIANGFRLTILPINGWPSSDVLNDITFDVDAIDGDGNLAA